MGAGRSGSTTLGVALDNVPGVFNSGELFAWFLFRGKPSSNRKETVDLWRSVGQRVPELERFHGSRFHRHLEHHSSLLKPTRWFSAKDRAEYHEANAALLRAIAEVTDDHVLVDTSHYPLRLSNLLALDGVDVHALYLVRDPRSVINALRKTVQRDRPMHPVKANIYCWIVALLSELVLLRVPARRKLRIRYEDFVERPAQQVERLVRQLGLPEGLPSAEDLSTGRMFQGNRLRLKEEISISRQPSKQQLSRAWTVMSTILLAPLLLLYGYGLRWKP
ncbi:sulfotransferase [Deltaproteobacteria bacterium]|nr:sulfotransferase [Deltaproteobacteria bacterium]